MGYANYFIRDLLYDKISELSIIGFKKISSLDQICRLAKHWACTDVQNKWEIYCIIFTLTWFWINYHNQNRKVTYVLYMDMKSNAWISPILCHKKTYLTIWLSRNCNTFVVRYWDIFKNLWNLVSNRLSKRNWSKIKHEYCSKKYESLLDQISMFGRDNITSFVWQDK